MEAGGGEGEAEVAKRQATGRAAEPLGASYALAGLAVDRGMGPALYPCAAAFVAGLPPSCPGQAANGLVRDQLRSGHSCDAPPKCYPDHSMGAGHAVWRSNQAQPGRNIRENE